MQGPGGNWVQSFCRSHDAGTSWTCPLTPFPGGLNPSAVVTGPIPGSGDAAGGFILVAVPWSGGASGGVEVFRSVDGGETWVHLSGSGWPELEPGDLHGITEMILDPRDGSTVWAVLEGRGVFHSHDGGESWSPVLEGLGSLWVDKLAFGEEGLYAATRAGVHHLDTSCTPTSEVACLLDGRFEVRMDFETVQAGGLGGPAQAISVAGLGVTSGALLHYGNPTNPEMLVKVLDGCAINGHYWLFHTAATNVGFELRVRDMLTGRLLTGTNPDLHPAEPYQDIRAFPCDLGGAAAVGVASRAAATPPRHSGPRSVPPVPRFPLAASSSGAGCSGGEHVLCIADRFQVEVGFETSQAGGLADKALAIPLAAVGVDRGGLFHFGNPTNPEVLLKVLDGCALNGHYWVFYSAATNVRLEVRVVDTLTGEEASYEGPDLTPATPVQDTAALPCQ